MEDYSGPSYSDLPMEIIIRILDYLNISDVLEASLSCRRWYDASLNLKFVSRIQVQFDKSPLSVFAGSLRCYTKIKLKQVELDPIILDFWHSFAKHLTDVEFNSCDLSEKMFITILKLIMNLKSLEINNCRELFMSGCLLKDQSDFRAISKACENVTKLSLCNNRYLSDALFMRIIRTMKNVQSLNLSGCQISFHSALYRKFYPDNEQESENVFTFFVILKFIESHAKQLKWLDFSETLIDGNALSKLAEVNNLQLEVLKLRSCDQITNSGVSKLIKKQQTLVALECESVRFTDQSLLDICQALSHLKILKIRRCRAITDESIKNIKHLKCLECLDISECYQISSNGFIECIANEPNYRLIELHARSLNICEIAVIKLAQTLTNLRLLDLSFCKNAVTDLAVQMIFKHLIKLRTLSLEFCDMISDKGMTGMEMQSQIDKYNGEMHQPNSDLSLQQNPHCISLRSKAEGEIVASRMKTMLHTFEESISNGKVNFSSYSIARLKGLRSLNLASCNRVGDISLKYAFDFLELEELNLSKCQHISAIGIECILSKCPSIKKLNLSDCNNLSDQAIEMISMLLKRLTDLHIERCSQLTDRSLDSIAMNCKRLKYLNVRGCRSVCSEPSLRLDNLHSLRQILMSKPGPYMVSFEKQPKAPPLPPSF